MQMVDFFETAAEYIAYLYNIDHIDSHHSTCYQLVYQEQDLVRRMLLINARCWVIRLDYYTQNSTANGLSFIRKHTLRPFFDIPTLFVIATATSTFDDTYPTFINREG